MCGSGDEFERRAVGGTHDGEVAVVVCRDRGDTEPFRDGGAGVDEHVRDLGVTPLDVAELEPLGKVELVVTLALLGILAPFAASAAGWVFTEMGRQPFVVAPNPTPGGIDGVFMFTASAVSPGVEPWEMIVSLVALTLVYLALLVVEVGLLWKYARAGVAGVMPELDESHDDTDKRLFLGGIGNDDSTWTRRLRLKRNNHHSFI